MIRTLVRSGMAMLQYSWADIEINALQTYDHILA
jgi:hypothetical protein